MSKQDWVVGIDLGTTNSLVGGHRDGRVELFAGDDGDVLLPSAVSIDERGVTMVGRAARNRRLLDPARTVMSVKRRMGRDRAVQIGSRTLSPPQVSALVIGALLDRAEARLAARPKRAIITVPAYFDDAQRQATRDAGELAGLAVERLVNEPTAAAMTQESGGESTVLVYDLGGGTFDVSVLERDGELLEVVTSRGDTQLGGDDIDEALVQWVLAQLDDRDAALVSADAAARTRLLEAVERAKIALSSRQEVTIFDPFAASDGARSVHLDRVLSRATLEEVARPFVERTLACIDRALADAKLTPEALDRVILVGGASGMPLVERMVSEHLDRPAHRDDRADRAVAEGASLLAGRAMGAAVEHVLVDITPHTLAAGALERGVGPLIASPVIARGTVVPVERSRTLYTHVDDQEVVAIPIAQGEERLIDDNAFLGEVQIEDLGPSPEGSPVEVTFKLDLSGILHVSATHMASQKSASTRIAKSPHRLAGRERAAARSQIESLRAERAQATADPAEAALAQALLARAERALERATEGAGDDARARRDELRAALAAGERLQPRIDALSDALLDLM